MSFVETLDKRRYVLIGGTLFCCLSFLLLITFEEYTEAQRQLSTEDRVLEEALSKLESRRRVWKEAFSEAEAVEERQETLKRSLAEHFSEAEFKSFLSNFGQRLDLSTADISVSVVDLPGQLKKASARVVLAGRPEKFYQWIRRLTKLQQTIEISGLSVEVLDNGTIRANASVGVLFESEENDKSYGSE